MPMSPAERQRRARERRREEAAAQARREEVLEILEQGSECCCCGAAYMTWLTLREGKVYCRNCAAVADEGGLCPHRGIGRLLR